MKISNNFLTKIDFRKMELSDLYKNNKSNEHFWTPAPNGLKKDKSSGWSTDASSLAPTPRHHSRAPPTRGPHASGRIRASRGKRSYYNARRRYPLLHWLIPANGATPCTARPRPAQSRRGPMRHTHGGRVCLVFKSRNLVFNFFRFLENMSKNIFANFKKRKTIIDPNRRKII